MFQMFTCINKVKLPQPQLQRWVKIAVCNWYKSGDKKTVRREVKTLLMGFMPYVLFLVTHSL